MLIRFNISKSFPVLLSQSTLNKKMMTYYLWLPQLIKLLIKKP